MKRYEKDGKIGVILAARFGRWSCRVEDRELREFLLMDHDLVDMVLKKDYGAAEDYVVSKVDHFRNRDVTNILSGCIVAWVEKDSQFKVTNHLMHDFGEEWEKLEVFKSEEWFSASEK